MKIDTNCKHILNRRHYLVAEQTKSENVEYLNAYLLSNFGIIVDKPELLTKNMISIIAEELKLFVPDSFYSNPQDLKYFTKEELLVEQLVSYFVGYGSDLNRIEIFKKDFPEYLVGDELKLRKFYIITEIEAKTILFDIIKAYCKYTRPFSLDEIKEFIILYNNGFYDDAFEISCKDNIFLLLKFDKTFVKFLDKKDIVKLSIDSFGDKANFKHIVNSDAFQTLKDIVSYLPYVKSCPLSRKQAKYYNKLRSFCDIKLAKATNDASPDKIANHLFIEGDTVGAAKIYAANGSMLLRRIKMLLSRANLQEALEILDMLPSDYPIVLFQLVSTLIADDSTPRTFTFYKNKKIKVHQETEKEASYRKSALNKTTRDFLANICITKIKDYYKNLPSLGKVYINNNFYKIALPTNTSSSGKGLDVPPTGTRLPCIGNKIRTFVYWNDAFDIDSSLIFVDKDNNLSTMGWYNYASKCFSVNNVYYSGDCTSKNGAEYFDIDIDSLKELGIKYVIQTFHGFACDLNSGKIFAGYQNKVDFNTKTWDPKNIELQFRVQGDSSACIAFAIDVETREIIIINQILDSDERIVNPSGYNIIKKYLHPEYLNVNIGLIAECRGNVVASPEEADIVFDDEYVAVDISESVKDEAGNVYKPQTVIRSYELEKLVAFINN